MKWIFILNLIYHPLPAEVELCIEYPDYEYTCADKRELFAGCTQEFNILMCPTLIGT
jgi:hypothetical protein